MATPEEKILEKIRKVLIADTALNAYLQTRVYTSHISSIDEPKYPAISLTLLNGQVMHPLNEVVRIRVQVDAWFPSAHDFNATDVLAAMGRVRALLHQQDLSDVDVDVLVYQSLHTESGPMMHEDETKLFHLPSVFEMVVK